jgi:hypothetical protein
MLMITSSPAAGLACRRKPADPSRQTDDHDATPRAAGGNLAPVLPLGGAVAPVAALVQERWPNSASHYRQQGLVFLGRKIGWRVARHSASQRKARKSMILW